MTNRARQAAQILLDIQAVSLSPQAPVTWASGLKSPIYTDNRLIMSYPKERKVIEYLLAQTVKEAFPGVTVIAGTATAGIPHAAYVSAQLDLPMVYVRSAAKDHGKARAIEGNLSKHDKVVLIEDLISTGRSVLKAAQHIQAEGAQVLGIVSIFNYQLQSGKAAFKEANLPYRSLTDYTTLIDVASEKGGLADYRQSLEDWYQDPVAWSDRQKN